MILHCFMRQRLTHKSVLKLISSHVYFKVFCRANGIDERNYAFAGVEYHAVDNELVFEYNRVHEVDGIIGVVFSSKDGYSHITNSSCKDIVRAVSKGQLLKNSRVISWKLINLIAHRQISSIAKLFKYTDDGITYLVGVCCGAERPFRPADLIYEGILDSKRYKAARGAGNILANERFIQLMNQPAESNFLRFISY